MMAATELIRRFGVEHVGQPDLPWDEGLRSLELTTLYFANEKNEKPGASFAKTFELLQHAENTEHPYLLCFVFDRPYRHMTIIPFPEQPHDRKPHTTGETMDVSAVVLARSIGAMAHKDRMMYTQGSVFVAQVKQQGQSTGEFTIGHFAYDIPQLNGWIEALQKAFTT